MNRLRMVEWEEVRIEDGTPERFLVRGELQSGHRWLFSERSMMDLCIIWFDVPSEPRLIARAEIEWATLLASMKRSPDFHEASVEATSTTAA
jgi:hypothetical protein